MKSKKIHIMAGTCLAAFCLSSCWTYCNIGKCIKDTGTTYTGVDTSKPVGGVVYKDGKGNSLSSSSPIEFIHRLLRRA